jgi:signal transduction histidine kinase
MSPKVHQKLESFKTNTYLLVREIKENFRQLLEELGMVRVLAGLGLTIGEFTHEVIQFAPSINGDISVLAEQTLDFEGLNSLENLRRTIALFIAYTSYFNATVSANVSRELRPQQIDIVVGDFVKIIRSDLDKSSINLETDFFGFDLVTIPMHQSEWSSILFNLYTNAKKAIKRAKVLGQIRIVGGNENEKVFLEFQDNGDGIPQENEGKIFEAFFTTSSPAGFDAPQEDRLTGTGLGLKIVKDIVQSYSGQIELIKPETGFNTCFRIELPGVNNLQKNGA